MADVTLPKIRENIETMKHAAYNQTRSLKPCISAPACTTHRHRPRPPPCRDPDRCYLAAKKTGKRCPSAWETVNRRGMPCECVRMMARQSRASNNYCSSTHRARVMAAYNRRSTVSRWYPPPSKKRKSSKSKKKKLTCDHGGTMKKKKKCVIL